MNLQQLNGGSPNEKLWLNPVANVITCNRLVESQSLPSSRLFQLVNVAGGQLPVLTNTPCDVAEIPGLGVDVLTNTYTAPADCFLQVSMQCNITCGAAGTSSDTYLQFLVNNIATSIRSRDFLSFNVVSGSACVGVSGIVKLSAGDRLSVVFGNAHVGAGFSYDLFRFSGFII